MDKIEKIKDWLKPYLEENKVRNEHDEGFFHCAMLLNDFLDTLSEEPDKSLEEEVNKCWEDWLSPSNQPSVEGVLPKSEFMMYARHFYELGKNSK